MFMQREVSLEDILSAREVRAERQKELIDKFNKCLISFTVNIPGKHKDSPLITRIFNEGLTTLNSKLRWKGFEVLHLQYYNKFTGPEAFIVVDGDQYDVKKISVDIEEKHPLGRLFDIDVLDRDCRPIQRNAINVNKRKCLICEDNAFNCARSRKHDAVELLNKIKEMSDGYFQKSS